MRKSIKAARKPANVTAPAAEIVKLDTATETPNTEISVSETVTEAKPDPRIVKAERIAADRASVKAFYAALNGSVSVPVKAISAFKLAPVSAHPIARQPSPRQAAAIATAFIANNVKLADGATAPRVFAIDGVQSAIENGALRDAISAGLVTVTGDKPEISTIKLAKNAAKIISGLLGEKALNAAYAA